MNSSFHESYKTVDRVSRPIIALLTDFGLQDGYVGVLKGVMLSIAPEAHLIDITHDIAPQQVAAGAWILATSYRYFPVGTVFTCIVDPGVGSTRFPVALHAGDWYFVGPDNGLFSPLLREQPVHEVVTLSNPAFHLPQVSTTFHGRDIFAPSAAHIAMGTPLSKLGPQLNAAHLQHLDQREAARDEAIVIGHVAHVDTYGNIITNIPSSLVSDLFSSPQVEMTFPEHHVVVTQRRRFFSEQPLQGDTLHEPFLYIDSSAHVGVAINKGNASQQLHIGYDAPVTLVLS